MYGKLFSSMYEGTLYGHWQALVTFQQMIILCDSDGVVDITPQALAARTSIPLDIILEGIKILEAPDPYSRTPGDEGRRIELLDDHRPWGWRIINHKYYRDLASREDKKEKDRERIAAKRQAEKSQVVASCRDLSQAVANVAYADADANTDSHSEPQPAAAKTANGKPGKRCPEDFVIPPEADDLMRAELPADFDLDRETAKFRDYEFARARKDWLAAWRNWMRKAMDDGRYAKRQGGIKWQ